MIWRKLLGIALISFLIYYFLGIAFIAKLVILVTILAVISHFVINGSGFPGNSRIVGGSIGIIVLAIIIGVYYREGSVKKVDEPSTSNALAKKSETPLQESIVIAPVSPGWSRQIDFKNFASYYPKTGSISLRKQNGDIISGITPWSGLATNGILLAEFQSELTSPIEVVIGIK